MTYLVPSTVAKGAKHYLMFGEEVGEGSLMTWLGHNSGQNYHE